VASIYKQYAAGAPALAGDEFQVLVGSLGAMLNGGGRLIWGVVSDKIGFKNSFLSLQVIQIAAMLLYSHSRSNKIAYLINTCVWFFCLAGNLALMPGVNQRLWGPREGAAIYGVMFSAFFIASFYGATISKLLSSLYGWEATFKIFSLMSLLSVFICLKLKPLAHKSFTTSSL